MLCPVYQVALHVLPGQHPQPCEVCVMFCISYGSPVPCLSY